MTPTCGRWRGPEAMQPALVQVRETEDGWDGGVGLGGHGLSQSLSFPTGLRGVGNLYGVLCPSLPSPLAGCPHPQEEGLTPGPIGWGLSRHLLCRTEANGPSTLGLGTEATAGPGQGQWVARPAFRTPGPRVEPGMEASTGPMAEGPPSLRRPQPHGISGFLGPPPATQGSRILS